MESKIMLEKVARSAAFVVVLACFALLFGCSSQTAASSNLSSSSSQQASSKSESDQNDVSAFVGTWDLIEMARGDDVLTAEKLDQMREQGTENFIIIEEDASVVFDDLNWYFYGTIQSSGSSEGVIDASDAMGTSSKNALPASIEGSRLSVVDGEYTYTFEQRGSTYTVPDITEVRASLLAYAGDWTLVEVEADGAGKRDVEEGYGSLKLGTGGSATFSMQFGENSNDTQWQPVGKVARLKQGSRWVDMTLSSFSMSDDDRLSFPLPATESTPEMTLIFKRA